MFIQPVNPRVAGAVKPQIVGPYCPYPPMHRWPEAVFVAPRAKR